MIFYANLQLTVDTMDRLKSTRLYNQKIKNLSNQLLRELEKLNDEFYENLSEDAEKQMHPVVNIIELFIDIVASSDVVRFKEFLEDYKVNKSGYADDKKVN